MTGERCSNCGGPVVHGEGYQRCVQCGDTREETRMTSERQMGNDEWRCFNGHVSYGEGFVPIGRDDEDGERERRRQPSHGKTRL